MWISIPRILPLGTTDTHAWRPGTRAAVSEHLRRFKEQPITANEAGTGITGTMPTTTTNAEVCSVCKEPVQGGFETFSYLRLGEPVIEVAGTPDRNYNVCDLCNVTICYRCSVDPESGYCNECYRMVRNAQRADRSTEAHEETNLTTMEEPQIIYRQSDGSDFSADERARLVLNLIQRREIEQSDFQGRIDSLCRKLADVTSDFQGYIGDIDAAIMDVMKATTLVDAQGAATQFDRTN